MFLSKCVRQKSNLALDNNKYKFEKNTFEPSVLIKDLPLISPKAVNLLEKIRTLDEADMKKDGKHYKHFIFCDVKSRVYGATFVASCLLADGYKLGYTSSHRILSDDELTSTKYNNFFLLSSLELFNKPMAVSTKKSILKKMNERPINVHGKLARIIIMDSGYKEGIDLFDIKYIHIFEPSVNAADMKQVIGRGTRTCGQKGLRFQPGIGWPLYVFIYDLKIQDSVSEQFIGATSLFDLYLKTIKIDIREVYFTGDLQRVSIRASVDYDLNKNIHDFKLRQIENEESKSGSGVYKGGVGANCSNLNMNDCDNTSGCLYVNGEKRQYCRKGTRRIIKLNPCSKLNNNDCNNTSGCFFVDGQQRKYCRKGTKKQQQQQPRNKSTNKSTNKTRSNKSISSLTDEASYESPKRSTTTRKSRSSSKGNHTENDNISSLTDDASYESQQKSTSKSKSTSTNTIPIIHKMDHDKLEDFIKDHFQHCKWDKISVENTCGEDMIPKSSLKGGTASATNNSNIIQYTPSQQFVGDFFRPSTFVKGMLLWHSVGTGKTCSAITAATKNFEPNGYTILWVTRTTLKEDIWKNMFDQICSEPIRKKVMQGYTIPKDRTDRMRLLSEAWKIRPLSYKQFTNLVSKNNQYYDKLVDINGAEDPLRKTLLIIDEAHKLYGGGDLSGIERPNMDELKRAIMKSYAISGTDSVRLLLMTATPITENPMELIKLLNLCKPADQQMPETFAEFSEEYLNEDGSFSRKGETNYMNNITGNLSYLNREFDVRQFAQPIIEEVISDFTPTDYFNDFSKTQIKDRLKDLKKTQTEELAKINQNPLLKLTSKNFSKLLNRCDTKTKKLQSGCKKMVKQEVKNILGQLAEYKTQLMREFKERFAEVDTLIKQGKGSENITAAGENMTIYYQLLNKCSTKIKNTSQLLEVQMIQDNINEVEEEIRLLIKEIKDLRSKKACFDNLVHIVNDKKEFIQKQKIQIKEVIAAYKENIRNQKQEEKAKEKLVKEQMKNIQDIEDIYRNRHDDIIDNNELKDLLQKWKESVEIQIDKLDDE